MSVSTELLIEGLCHLLTPDHFRGQEACRLFHGRGGCHPFGRDLFIDFYPPLVHVACFSPPTPELITCLQNLVPGELVPVLQRRDLPGSPCELLRGSLPPAPLAQEEGLRYQLFFDRDRNVGFFPDMRIGRQLLRKIAGGRRVLNLFAYTCSLSVAALAGGAQKVVNLDMNRSLLAVGREHHRLNDLDLRQVSFLAHNLFKSFARLSRLGPFDLIVVDPPDTQGKNFRPERDWPKMLRRLPELLAPGGELLLSVSSSSLGLSFLQRQVAESLPEAICLGHYTAGENFCEADPDKGLHLLHLMASQKARPTLL